MKETDYSGYIYIYIYIYIYTYIYLQFFNSENTSKKRGVPPSPRTEDGGTLQKKQHAYKYLRTYK